MNSALIDSELTQSETVVVVVRDPRELREHLSAWERLAETALEPNVFYEPFMMLPAIEWLRGQHEVEFVLVFTAQHEGPQASPVLSGFFPLRRHRSYYRAPIECVSLWRYDFCYLCTPLIRADQATTVLRAFLNWLATSEDGSRLLKIADLASDGPFHHVLMELLRYRRNVSWISRQYSRAMLRPQSSFDEYECTVLSRNMRKKLRRQNRRLAKLGTIEFCTLTPNDDVDTWLKDFLRLEASGWKGRKQTAMASSPASKAFLLQAARTAFRSRRLWMSALKLNGSPLAINCDFLGGEGCFGFKAGYDESFSSYSPGLLLERSNLARIHQSPDVGWMDWCSVADHPVFDRVANAHRTIQSLWISTGRFTGDLAVSLLPLSRKVLRTAGIVPYLPGGNR